jgi:hypothetical protein
MGNYKLNEIVANKLTEQGHEVYLLQQLNGILATDEYIQQIKDLSPDVVYSEMLDTETFKVVEQLENCEKVLLYASNGILGNFDDILNYKDKWYTKIITNSKIMYNKFKNNGTPTQFFEYYFSVLNDKDLVVENKYKHDCVFLGMGFNRLESSDYELERSLFFSDFSKFDYKIYGNGWPTQSWYNGMLPADDIGKLYSSAKCGVAIIAMSQRQHGMINNRYTEMAYSKIPIITPNYDTVDWYGADKYLNFVSTRGEFEDIVKRCKNGDDDIRIKVENMKKFIVNQNEQFFDKLKELI